MFVRRRKHRIEIEKNTFRVEYTSAIPPPTQHNPAEDVESPTNRASPRQPDEPKIKSPSCETGDKQQH
jgi:hypothetical protein